MVRIEITLYYAHYIYTVQLHEGQRNMCDVEATSLLKALRANSFVLEDLYYRNFILNYCYIMKTKSFLVILNTFPDLCSQL